MGCNAKQPCDKYKTNLCTPNCEEWVPSPSSKAWYCDIWAKGCSKTKHECPQCPNYNKGRKGVKRVYPRSALNYTGQIE